MQRAIRAHALCSKMRDDGADAIYAARYACLR
jgi:hypothetical protein